MLQVSEILSILFNKHEQKGSVETFIDYKYKAEASRPKPNLKNSLSSYLNNLTHRDIINITIFPSGGQFTFESEKSDADNSNFYSNWEDFASSADEDEKFSVSVAIKKVTQDLDTFFVYDFTALLKTIDELNNIELIEAVSGLFNKTGSRIFLIPLDRSDGFSTRTIKSVKSIEEKRLIPKDNLNRSKLWEKLRGISHFSGISNCIALPEDFELAEVGPLPPSLQKKFQQCMFILSLVIIFDLATIEGDKLTLKLNGYKTFTISKQLSALDLNELQTYYDIYNWMISGGSIQDKAGLARNLISLNLGQPPNFEIASTSYNSILSGYKVYERQNIKQYIDLRNRMSDQIVAFNEKAAKIVDGFAGSFQKSALAVVSLYASLIIAKVLSAANPIGAFSLGATILSFAFLFISLIYFFVSMKEVRENRTRFVDAYGNMKARNQDLLEAEDIKRILNNDKEHIEDLRYIDEKIRWYRTLWIMLLAIFAAATIILFAINQYR
jgi:hypothetical protein